MREKSFKIKSEGKNSEAVQFKQKRGYKMVGGRNLEGVLAKNRIGRRHMEIHHFINLVFKVWKEVPYTMNKANLRSQGKSKEN